MNKIKIKEVLVISIYAFFVRDLKIIEYWGLISDEGHKHKRKLLG